MKLSDKLIGILAVLGGLAIISGTFGFRSVPGQQFGSAFFPRIVGGIAILIGCAQIYTAQPAKWIEVPKAWGLAQVLPRVMAVTGVIFWLLTVETLGFMLTTAVVILFLAIVLGARLFPASLAAFGGTVAFHLVFSVLLRVPLPRGVIEVWIS